MDETIKKIDYISKQFEAKSQVKVLQEMKKHIDNKINSLTADIERYELLIEEIKRG